MHRKLILLFILILDFYWFVYLSEKLQFVDNNDLTNWFTLSIEMMIGLFVAIGVTVYFKEKEHRGQEQKRKEGLKQICDRFIHSLEHVKAVNEKVRQYYRIINSNDLSINYSANVELVKKQSELRIQGLRNSATALENSLLLVAGDLEHNIKSGMRFYLDVVERDTSLFENEFSDMQKLDGLVGVANATKERLVKTNPTLIKNAESELEELKQKIQEKKNASQEIMDFVWKE